MTRQRLNLTARAWRNMRRSWRPRPSAELLWQSYVTGPVLSATAALQQKLTEPQQLDIKLDGALVIIGYWRSGTTLLHELLATSGRWCFPSTHACMHPQSFALAAAPETAMGVSRPMDGMTITSGTPQEDEFALFGLGARSPYEALLFPGHLAEALRLSALENLSPEERDHWIATFRSFTGLVAAQGKGKPILLKSPPHAERIAALRQVMPDCKFAVIVRSPLEVFESTTRMWRSMFKTYAHTPVPQDEDIRNAVLAHRLDYEARLHASLSSLPQEDFAIVRFEDLTRTPQSAVSQLLSNLHIEGADAAGIAAALEMRNRSAYHPLRAIPDPSWCAKVHSQWSSVSRHYGYTDAPTPPA